jgi:hypothetical protein
MSQTTDQLLNATLALPEPDRKKIAEALTASLPAGEQPPTNGAGIPSVEETKVNRMALITLANWKPESPLPPPPNPPKYEWPPDVWEFAVRHQVAGYLDPMMDAAHETFPGASGFSAYLEGDPEIPEEWHIVYNVCLPGLHFPGPDLDKVQATRKSYYRATSKVCPSPLMLIFRLRLDFPD